MTKMRINEALYELGKIVGHDALIIDNANEPAPIEGVLDEIIDSVGGYMDDIPEEDYAISEDGITIIKEDGYLESEPMYRVFSGTVRGEYFSGEWLDGSPMEGYGIYTVTDGEVSTYGRFSPSGKIEDSIDCGDLCKSARESEFVQVSE